MDSERFQCATFANKDRKETRRARNLRKPSLQGYEPSVTGFHPLLTTIRCGWWILSQSKWKLKPVLQIISRSVITLESKVETLQAEMEALERWTEEIIDQCSVSASSNSRFARFVKEKVSELFQPFSPSVELNLRNWAALKTGKLQQYSSATVQVDKSGISGHGSGSNTPWWDDISNFLPTGPIRDCSYYTPSNLSKEEGM